MPLEVASALELHVAGLINASRAEAGLAPVHVELHLNDAAQAHSDWMSEAGTLSHRGAEGSSPADRAADSEFPLDGGSWHLTENVAYKGISGHPGQDDVAEMHAALMQSSAHQGNILDPNVDYLGVGISTGQMEIGGEMQDVVYMTQNFASTSQPVLVQEDRDGQTVATTYVDGEPVEGSSRPVEREDEDEDQDTGEEPAAEEDGQQQDGSGGACFVATAAYGDRMHPDVVTLRRLRDEILVNHRTGQAFIRVYWSVGPRIARLVDCRRATGRLARLLLRPFVAGAARLVSRQDRQRLVMPDEPRRVCRTSFD